MYRLKNKIKMKSFDFHCKEIVEKRKKQDFTKIFSYLEIIKKQSFSFNYSIADKKF